MTPKDGPADSELGALRHVMSVMHLQAPPVRRIAGTDEHLANSIQILAKVHHETAKLLERPTHLLDGAKPEPEDVDRAHEEIDRMREEMSRLLAEAGAVMQHPEEQGESFKLPLQALMTCSAAVPVQLRSVASAVCASHKGLMHVGLHQH